MSWTPAIPVMTVACALLVPACSGGNKSQPAKVSKREPAPKAPVERPAAPEWKWSLPKGLGDPPPVPADNPMSLQKVSLGHRLFMDRRLSVDGSRSCYSCHQNELGNADGRATALGAAGEPIPRNSPTIWNVAYHAELYWDGRGASLEKQAIGALKGKGMGLGEGLAAKAAEIGKLPEYLADFRQAFGLGREDAVTPDHIAMALSTYERTLLCGGTRHDRQAYSDAQKRGWELFIGKAGCITCHTGPNFTDGLYHNVGIAVPADGTPAEGSDIGRGKVTKDAADNFKFRTPTLRNVAETAPYFHDGSTATLEEAVRIMASGGVEGAPNRDPLLQDRKLTDEELADLVDFLDTLSCSGRLKVIGDQKVPEIPT